MRKFSIILRCTLVLACFAMCSSIISCSPQISQRTDSLPPLTASEYQGYRLSVTNLTIKKKKSKWASVSYTLINTGRNDIQLMKSSSGPYQILVEFDHSLQSTELEPYKSQIIAAVLNQDLYIGQGQYAKDQALKINLKNKADDTSFTIDVGQSSSTSDRYYDKNYCPDLHIDSIRIVKLTKKWVTVEYRISNIGKGPASLSGESDSDNDNVKVRAHLSGSKRLSRGAVAIGGTTINDQEVLEVGQSYTGVFRIDIRKKTRYTSVLILELDPYSSVRECDETNNQRPVVLEQ